MAEVSVAPVGHNKIQSNCFRSYRIAKTLEPKLRKHRSINLYSSLYHCFKFAVASSSSGLSKWNGFLWARALDAQKILRGNAHFFRGVFETTGHCLRKIQFDRLHRSDSTRLYRASQL
jgi:hypothetical protein